MKTRWLSEVKPKFGGAFNATPLASSEEKCRPEIWEIR
jgi:hypothetical protein